MSRLLAHQGYNPQELLGDKFLSKGTGFTETERDELKLRGLLPPKEEPLLLQADREIQHIRDEPSSLHKYMYLAALYGRNRTLFFRVLIDNLVELLPLVYTPTVGEACQKFGRIFTNPSGMYFSIQDRGLFRRMLDNWMEKPEILVATDGGRILGLGDQGAGGMGIPIGKLQLYVAGGGYNPRKVLPVQLDVGTDRQSLLDDPFYLGLKYRRLRGAAHEEFVDEFVKAIHDKWPECVIQFEDFQSDWALHYLEKYRHKYCFFNDDVQGTAAIATAGFINGMKVQGTHLTEARVVFFGAGSSACGCAEGITQVMIHAGLTREQAVNRIYMMDIDGLVTLTRATKPNQWAARFAKAKPPGGKEITDIAELIRVVKPNALYGLTGAGPVWKPEVLEAMTQSVGQPLIFPLSNPTSCAEVTFENAIKWTDGKLLFAAGSPFAPIEYNGKTFYASQCNNMFIFPGVGRAATLGKCRKITDNMFTAAAHAVADSVPDDYLAAGRLYPNLQYLRDVGKKIVVACWKQATEDGVAQVPVPINVDEVVEHSYYEPAYGNLTGC